MPRFKQHRRRPFLIVIIAIFAVFASTCGSLYYFGDQLIAKQQAESKALHAKMDKAIADIKAKKLAEKKAAEEAKKKAAAQKAASDAALAAQLKGQVVTPPGCAITGEHGDPTQINVVINKKHCFSPINYTPADKASFQGYILSAKVIPNLTAMYNAASAAGVPFGLTSSYRSYTDQVTTYNHWVAVNGSYAAADTVSARPGYSEHQTGFAMDLDAGSCSLECFAGTAQYTWLKKHAAEYGFIERYPPGLEAVTGYSPEAWHWRYVGTATAQEMKSKGIKTLEQLWNISGGSY